MSDSGGRGEWGDLPRGCMLDGRLKMAGLRWCWLNNARAGEGMCSGMLEIPGLRCWAQVCSRGCRLRWLKMPGLRWCMVGEDE